MRNLSTGYISPQFHLVFDDLFETINGSGGDNEVTDEICNRLFETNRDWYVEDEVDEDGELVYTPPPLEEVWLDKPDRRERKEKLARQREQAAQRERVKWADKIPDTPSDKVDGPPALLPQNVVSDSNSDSSDDDSSTGDVSESGGDVLKFDNPLDNPVLPPEGADQPQQRCTQWGRNPDGRLRRLDTAQYHCSLGNKQVPAYAYRLSRKRRKYRQ